jgi:2-polyprenyl-6-methoxyphenol hydroxylase-like FAD-dependent oxidoreductase
VHSDRSTPTVLIIGAGTGGMALAHGLKNAGIGVRVFERDRTRSDGLYGYRVGIDADGSRALHALLPPGLFETFVATCAKPMRALTFWTEQLVEILDLPFPDQVDPIESEKSVSRMTLRQILLTGMEDIVEYDKTFSRFEQNADGSVTAWFEDGSSTTGDLLVGADGTRSRVRRQHLPHAEIRDAGVVAVAGKVPLDDARTVLPGRMLEGSSMIFAPRGLFSINHVMEFPWDRSGAVKAGVGGNEANLIAVWPGLLYDNTRDYFMWSVADAAAKAPAGVEQARGEEVVRIARVMTADWSPTYHRLIDLSDLGSCFSVNVATSVPINAWPASNVTLIGDAIHTMTPGRGVGANTALRDAQLLCRTLVEVRDGRRSLVDAVADYETRMRAYAWKAVEESLENQGADNPLYRPVVGRLMLAAVRTAFRVVDRVPPLKRRMTSSMLRSRGAGRRDEDDGVAIGETAHVPSDPRLAP